MKLEDVLEIYDLISRGTQHISIRKQARQLRKKALESAQSTTLTKVAFDTRRIDQEATYIPRRGLQNYHRSEQFVSEATFQKVQAFDKLNKVLDQMKEDFGRDAEWHDSYARILSSAIQKGLRTEQLDGDFSDAQPSMASLAYLEELLFVRYRLTPDNLASMSEDQLRKSLLQKDELLLRKDSGLQLSGRAPEIVPSDITKLSYQQMMEKMLASMAHIIQQKQVVENTTAPVITTKDNDRTITITIKG